MSRCRRSVLAVLLVAVAASLVLTVAACAGSSLGPAPGPQPPGPKSPVLRAAAALGAFEAAFYTTTSSGAYDALSTSGRRSNFWRQAEMIEMEEDAAQVNHDPGAQQRVIALMDGVVALHGRNWTGHSWNDDILWMVIAAVRAWQMTGDSTYLDMAKQNFDATYARAWSSDLGGGLWWTAAQTQKNTTTNGPAAIAACLLAKALNDPSYLAKAQGLYSWVRSTLYDPRSGAVWDRVDVLPGGGSKVSRAQITYNEGTFIGAAELLRQATGTSSYYRDGLRTLKYTRDHMTTDGILPAETGTNANLGGFKGIFCRYAGVFIRANHLRRFTPWLRRNADVAWSHRDARGLIWADWAAQTGGGDLLSWDCSSAVVLLLTVASL